MPHSTLTPRSSAAIAVAAARAYLDDLPTYETVMARVPPPALIANIYPDRTAAALSLGDPRWKVHPPTGVLPPEVLQELKARICVLPQGTIRVDASSQVKAPLPSAPPLSCIGSSIDSRGAAPRKHGAVEKAAKRLQDASEQHTLQLLKKTRKLEAELLKLKGELQQARAKPRG